MEGTHSQGTVDLEPGAGRQGGPQGGSDDCTDGQ